jgi:xylulokinase
VSLRSKNPAALGVDVGTSSCKTILLDRHARVIVSATRSYSTRRSADGAATQEPSDWLRAAAATMRECVRASGGHRVEAIGVTGPAHAAVLVDEAGEPLGPSLLFCDARPEATAEMLRAGYGDPFFETTFVNLSAAWTLPQLVWLQGQLTPSRWARIRTVLPQKDYVRFAMTGIAATDPSDAAGTAMVDQRTGSWAESLLADAGLTVDQVPPILPARASAGSLSPSWARRVGIPAGTPVAVGATDTVADLVSVNALEPGASIVKIASTGSVVAVSDRPHPHPQLLTYPFDPPRLWYSAAATNTAATAYSWLREVLSQRPSLGALAYRDMDAAAARVPPGANGLLFLPFLEGERGRYWDRRLRAAFLGLSAAHTQSHLVRAVLEGVAFSLRDCLELMRALGLEVNQACFTGGGAGSRVWRSILAATLAQTGDLPDPQGPAVGAALLGAGALTGSEGSALALRAAPRLRRVEPNLEWVEIYERLYRMYLHAAAQQISLSHELAEFAEG